MKVKVLVTDGPNKNTLAILRALGKSNYKIDVTSNYSKVFTLSFYSRYCNKVHTLKSKSQNIDDYAEELIGILKNDNYDMLIPVGLTSYLAVTKHKDKFKKLTHLLVPEWNVMQIASNKDKTMAFANEHEIPIPETCVLYEESDLESINKFPVVIKSSDGAGSFVYYCNNKIELYKHYTYLKSISKTNIISQEYVTGFGCGFYGVYKNGKLITHFLHRRIKEFPITGGASAVAESYYDEKLYNYGKKLCDALKWNGPIMVEFKYDIKNDDYKLIEINPKLWGSLDLTIEAGVNIPEVIIDLALHNIEKSNAEYKYIKYKWLFPDEFKVLISDISLNSLKDFFSTDNNTKTNYYWNDPLPFIIQIMRSLLYAPLIFFSNKKKFPHGKVGVINNINIDKGENFER